MDIKKIIEIMDYIYLNDEKLKDENILNKFGKENFIDFQRYCCGNGIQEFAIKYGKDDIYKLTQYGIIELKELKQEQILLEIQKNQTNFNRVLAVATTILALGVVYQIVNDFVRAQTYFKQNPLSMAIFGLLIVGIIFFLAGHIITLNLATIFKKK